jgi:ParB-like chromosome segregation protein Spo0J
MNSHKFANVFPMLSDTELADMAADIKCRGLLNPIITLDGEILDGRNRLRACELAEVKPSFVEYSGTDPLADVLSWNLHRRQLDQSQRASVALTVKPLFEEQARQRQVEGGKNKDVANLPQAEKGRSRDHAAEVCGVSPRLVQSAQYVRDHDPEAFEEVKAGTLTVNAAVQQIKQAAQEKEEQRYIDPLSKGVNTKDVDKDPDADNEIIMGLRRYWRKATKKEKASFLAWTKEGSK